MGCSILEFRVTQNDWINISQKISGRFLTLKNVWIVLYYNSISEIFSKLAPYIMYLSVSIIDHQKHLHLCLLQIRKNPHKYFSLPLYEFLSESAVELMSGGEFAK
jgi:hypothetical protein